MGVPDPLPSATTTDHPIGIPTPPHLYPQAIQLKLYQAFIFSIPILFSIILFLLFYLFYLKRTTTRSLPPAAGPILSRTSNRPSAPFSLSPSEIVVEGKLKERLPTILFDDDDLGGGGAKRDSLCCVCLGEFMAKEELIQLPGCRHLFHVECIHHWLCTNSTCPLCRSTVSVLPTTPCKLIQSQPSLPPSPSPTSDAGGGRPAFQVELLHYNDDQQQQQHRLLYSSAPAQQQLQQSQPHTRQVIHIIN